MTIHQQRHDLTDRQARAVIVSAERHGFDREPGLIHWYYDDRVHADAQDAARYLAVHAPADLAVAMTAPEPIPTWLAVERITNQGCRMTGADVEPLILAAVERGLMEPQPISPLRDWTRAQFAVGLLWEHAPERLAEILDDRARLATIPDTAVARCPSCCDGGWVTYRFAGEMATTPPPYDYYGPYAADGSVDQFKDCPF